MIRQTLLARLEGIARLVLTLIVSLASQHASALTAQNITGFSPATPISYSAAETFNLSATGGASGNAVIFASTSTSICTVSGSNVNILGVGKCVLTANQAGNGSYSAAPQVTATVVINKGSQTIAFTEPTSVPYGSPVALSANASSGLAIAFTSSTTKICTVSGSTATLIGLGTCTIAANQAGNANYSAATKVTQSFTVTKADQTITFPAPPTITLGWAGTAAASASSSLAVTFTSMTPQICTMFGSTISASGIGVCTIAANQAGNTFYNAAAQVLQSVNIFYGQSINNFTLPASAAVGSTPLIAAGSATSGLPVTYTTSTPTTCNVSGSSVTVVAVGTCTVAANQAGDSNYGPAPQVTQTVNVTKGSQTISFPTISSKISLTPFSVSATSNCGLPISFSSSTTSICTVAGTTVTLLTPGTCTISANQAGNSNCSAAQSVTQSFGVTVAALPTVALTSPQSGQTLLAPTITLAATAASSDAAITSVQFFNGPTLIGTATQAPYTLNWSNVTPDTYSIVATAIDNLGAVASTSPVSITVANPISVNIASPATGQEFVGPATLSLTAFASDRSGTISEVAFFNGGTLMGTVTQTPYSLSMPNLPVGAYSITARATDNFGLTAISVPVNVTVASNGGVIAGSSDTAYYVHTDQINTPRMIADQSGNAVWTWDSVEAFGDSQPNQDPNGTGNQFVFNLRFPGQYYDSETGMHYNFFRDYDPTTGRYIESDTFGLAGGINTYAYANGNPLVNSDPNGAFALSLPVVVTITIVVVGLEIYIHQKPPAMASGQGNKNSSSISDIINRLTGRCKENCPLESATLTTNENDVQFTPPKKPGESLISKGAYITCVYKCPSGRTYIEDHYVPPEMTSYFQGNDQRIRNYCPSSVSN